MANDETIQRIHVDLLEIDDYVYYYEGKPYTGVAYDQRPDGKLWSEQTFMLGLRDGPSRDWDESGQLESEDSYKFGLPHGPERAWYPDGQLKRELQYELGVLVARRRWDEQGELLEDYRLAPHTAEFKRLQNGYGGEEERVRALLGKLGGAPTESGSRL